MKLNSSPVTKYFFGGCIVVFVGIVVLAASLIRNPQEMRIVRIDEKRVSDLIRISRSVETYFHDQRRLPDTLAEVVSGNRQYVSLQDPETAAQYSYRVLDVQTFEVCAVFATSTANSKEQRFVYIGGVDRDWRHGAGQQCFKLDLKPKGE